VTRVRLGYLLVLLGVVCFSLNAGVSRLVLDSGVGAWTLSELRALGAAVLLFALIALTGRLSGLRLPRSRWGLLLLYGVVGLGLLQALYFEAIARIPLGLAILIEYLAPLWVALWARFVQRQPVRATIWPALAITFAGLAIVAGAQFRDLDPVGLLSAFLAGFCFAVYFIVGETLVAEHDAFIVTFWGFTIAGLTFLAASAVLPQLLPPWQVGYRVPVELPAALGAAVLPVAALLVWIVLLGTVVPFASETAAMRWVPATVVSVLAMLEPVGSAAVGWWWFDEQLTAFQAFGAVMVLVGITMALFSRAAHPTVAAVE
jgi:drug/metabolite transporter (DMT)-like permease